MKQMNIHNVSILSIAVQIVNTWALNFSTSVHDEANEYAQRKASCISLYDTTYQPHLQPFFPPHDALENPKQI